MTVLLSSHILAEVQQVCDSATIIGNGRVLSSGSVEDLVGRESAPGVRLRVAEPERARHLLEAAGLARHRSTAPACTSRASRTRP